MIEIILLILLTIGSGPSEPPLRYASVQPAPDKCTKYDLVKVNISVTTNEGRVLNTAQPVIVRPTCEENWEVFGSNAYYKNYKYEIFCFNGDSTEAAVLRTPLDDWIIFKNGPLVGCDI